MSEKKTKKREGKAININSDIHKMLKIQSTLTEKNMVELVETAILNNMPKEVLAIFNMAKDTEISKNKLSSNEELVEEKDISNSNKIIISEEEIKENNVKNKEELINEIDDETSCYL